MDIQLNFINQSYDENNSDVVIFQKNVATDFEELVVAWRIIQNIGYGWRHPFKFPMEVSASVSDSYGNYSPQIKVLPGQAYSVTKSPSGDAFGYSGPAVSTSEIEIRNNLQQGAINANIYKDGKLLAVKTGISPGQKAVFEFKPTLWIGVVSQLTEGEIMNSAIVSQINTEINLLGVVSADIVMTGGGVGPNAQPFEFTLDNVKMVSGGAAQVEPKAPQAERGEE